MLKRLYLPFLLEAQNPDGGWGYRRGGQSGVEPTCWALLALLGSQEVEKSRSREVRKPRGEGGDAPNSCPPPLGGEGGAQRQVRGFIRHHTMQTSVGAGRARGVECSGNETATSTSDPQLLNFSTSRLLDSVRWLRDCQLRDGSWPAIAGQPHGCWVTAVASLALYAHGGWLDHVARGLHWLANTWPAEGGIGWRMGARLLRRSRVVQQDSSLRGWGWTSGTASWVEPTACALIAFRHIPEELHPRTARRRRRLAERMLYDRMCPGGGWNCGNPLVYGTAGVPRIGPTVWALLALRDYRCRPENLRSLDWLEQAYPQIQAPGSLALAHFCLQFHDRPVPALESSLATLNSNNQFLGNTLVAAWAAMALSGWPRWLGQETGN